jgi:hypothetical protein
MTSVNSKRGRLVQLMLVFALAAPACIDVDVDATPPAPVDAGTGREVPVACDGALCNTSNGSQCNAGGDPMLVVGVAVALAAMIAKRGKGAKR